MLASMVGAKSLLPFSIGATRSMPLIMQADNAARSNSQG